MNSPASNRRPALDAFRGLIMLLMALDHARDFLSEARFSPLDLARTTPGLFLTRWMTHLCAPGFVLLAGIGARLWAESNGRSQAQLARLLLRRGLWLILLELTVVHLAWFLTLEYEIVLLQVIWVIGWSMVVLAGMVFAPDWLILLLSVGMMAGHNLLDGYAPGGEWGRLVWSFLHRPGLFPLWPERALYVLYPLIPWPGVMGLGYVLGGWYRRGEPSPARKLAGLGGVLILAFVILRAGNTYGDAVRWFPRADAVTTMLAFINVEKYPPSLLFLLGTLGICLLLMAGFERLRAGASTVLAVYGRVPLFFYILHLFAIHLSAVGLAEMKYGRAGWLFGAAWFFREGYPPGYGYNLTGVYLAWLLIVAGLYPLCRWFARRKERNRNGWMVYF